MISSTPIFACSDINKTLAHYKDVLGFESLWTWGETPDFGGASMGGVSIFFNLQPDLAKRIHGHQHWIKVDDADELCAFHRAKGAKIVAELEDKPWSVREYIVEDINGYLLRFAGPPSSEVPKSQPFPDGVTIERRLATAEEFFHVCSKAFGNSEVGFGDTAESVLARTWNGVSARSPSGETIGVLRIVHDAPGWFSIWEVAVLPDWQAKRIGSKMMDEAAAMIREACPGAIVFLFTFKRKFYARLGYGEESVCMRRL